jgi:hypothetical protein
MRASTRSAAAQLALLGGAFLAGGFVRVVQRHAEVTPWLRLSTSRDEPASPTVPSFDHGKRSSIGSDGYVLETVGGCHSDQCGPFCHRCACDDPAICVVCKAGAFLLVRLEPPRELVTSGMCVHACPPQHEQKGGGVFNRCVVLHHSTHPISSDFFLGQVLHLLGTLMSLF